MGRITSTAVRFLLTCWNIGERLGIPTYRRFCGSGCFCCGEAVRSSIVHCSFCACCTGEQKGGADWRNSEHCALYGILELLMHLGAVRSDGADISILCISS